MSEVERVARLLFRVANRHISSGLEDRWELPADYYDMARVVVADQAAHLREIMKSSNGLCPVCGAWVKDGHEPDCILAARLGT